LSDGAEVQIREVSLAERGRLDGILEQSFDGVYLRHARRTLGDVQTVRAAFLGEEPVGLSMLKVLDGKAGYVYYVAVASAHRGKGIGSRLVRDAVAYLTSSEVKEVYASVGEDNVESNALFRGNGFRKTNYVEVSRKYGMLKAVSMYRSMFVVPGEVLLVLDNLTMTQSMAEVPGTSRS
jgi:ribosomal protein S18 acetylase RimI-like enzyme